MVLVSICKVETGLKTVNNYTDPNGGSYGMCQINLNTARMIEPWMDRLALQQDIVNITTAAKYLKKLSNNTYSNAELIASYNAGSVRYTDDGLFINQEYVDNVMNEMSHQ